MRTIGLGNALVDVVLRVKDESVLSDIGIAKGAMELIDKDQMIRLRSASTDLSRSVSPGGSVCNTIRAMANLGANVGYIGKIGSDELAQSYESALQQAGVEPNFVKTEGISDSCTVFVTPDGERTMATFLGPAATLNPAELKSEIIRTYDCIYIEGYLIVNEPLFREALSLAKEAGLKVALDLSSFNVVESNLAMLQEVIPAYVDILFCNEQESFSFTGLSPREEHPGWHRWWILQWLHWVERERWWQQATRLSLLMPLKPWLWIQRVPAIISQQAFYSG